MALPPSDPRVILNSIEDPYPGAHEAPPDEQVFLAPMLCVGAHHEHALREMQTAGLAFSSRAMEEAPTKALSPFWDAPGSWPA